MDPRPTIKTVAVNVIIFLFLLFIISGVMGFVNPAWSFIVPFFFLPVIVKPLYRKFVYGRKTEYSRTSDKRFKTGQRITGSSTVADKTNKIELNESEIRLMRIEGVVKMAAFLFALYTAYPGFSKELSKSEVREKTPANPKGDLIINKDSWTPKKEVTSFGSELSSAPTFTITNKSKYYSYRRIDITIVFFDKKGRKLDSTILRKPVLPPGKTESIGFVSITGMNPNAKSASAYVQSAESERQ